jgi:hypothetical protein
VGVIVDSPRSKFHHRSMRNNEDIIASVLYTKSPHLLKGLTVWRNRWNDCRVFSTTVVILLFCGVFYYVTLSKLCSIEWWCDGWIGKHFEGSCRCLIEVLSLHLLGRTEEEHEKPQSNRRWLGRDSNRAPLHHCTINWEECERTMALSVTRHLPGTEKTHKGSHWRLPFSKTRFRLGVIELVLDEHEVLDCY